MVSIIVPIYNVYGYIYQCLESIEKQTYKYLDVIMVNDGATDGSDKIAQTFADKDNRFKLINQKNAGLSVARNTGLNLAKGDFVFYLDSDDYLKQSCIEKLVEIALSKRADVVQTNFYYNYPNHLLFNDKYKNNVQFYSKKEALIKLIEQKEIKNFAWGKLIRADIAKLYLFPRGKYFEDTLWMYQIIKATEKYAISGEPLLYYLQRETSISGGFSMRNCDQLELNSERLKLIKQQESSQVYFKALKIFNDLILQHQSIVSKTSTKLNRTQYQELLNEYIMEFGLKEHFALRHRISNTMVLNLLNSIYQGIKNKFLRKSYWVFISKN
jgi:glycosyltransferase involved in cell wall biosynthesis